MYTLKSQFVPRITYFLSGPTVSPKILSFSELQGASDAQILQTIVAREIASKFGVGSMDLKEALARASYDLSMELSPEDGQFFHSLIGVLIDGNQMNRSERIISSFRERIPSLDDLLNRSPIK